MIKTNQSIPQESSASECWKENPSCVALRVEPEEGGIFLLPYLQLAFGHYRLGEDGEELAVVFTTHAVILKSRRLRGLLPPASGTSSGAASGEASTPMR